MVQESAAEVGLCYTHNAPVRCLLGFLFRKGNAEALDRRGGKTKQQLISHFLRKTLASVIYCHCYLVYRPQGCIKLDLT